ncbi:MAG TPA: EamA family transporter [Bryobacteraceae bacterium]|nr:EamA family transporter [Bryobacteraceae bacterium]
MTATTFSLVALSALMHAYWNFLLKRSGGSQTVVALSKLVEAALFLPLLVFGGTPHAGQLRDLWLLPSIGAVFVLANYVLLAAAYMRGDLSIIYPVVRGGILAFLPPLAYLTIGERLTPLGWTAIAAILTGIVVLQYRRGPVGAGASTTAILLALAAGLVSAGNTIWDKAAIQTLSPITYFGAYTVIVGVCYSAILRRTAAATIWRDHRWAIVQIGLFNSGSYLLALAALKTGGATHVIATRQLSIAIGALLGWRWLGEALPAPRIAGILFIVAGCILMGVAR